MHDKGQWIYIRGDIDEFGAIVTSAVRYCLGRRSYEPKLVTQWIMNNLAGRLTRRTISTMISDIGDQEQKEEGLGMDCDKRTWYEFRAWLNHQLMIALYKDD